MDCDSRNVLQPVIVTLSPDAIGTKNDILGKARWQVGSAMPGVQIAETGHGGASFWAMPSVIEHGAEAALTIFALQCTP